MSLSNKIERLKEDWESWMTGYKQNLNLINLHFEKYKRQASHIRSSRGEILRDLLKQNVKVVSNMIAIDKKIKEITKKTY